MIEEGIRPSVKKVLETLEKNTEAKLAVLEVSVIYERIIAQMAGAAVESPEDVTTPKVSSQAPPPPAPQRPTDKTRMGNQGIDGIDPLLEEKIKKFKEAGGP